MLPDSPTETSTKMENLPAKQPAERKETADWSLFLVVFAVSAGLLILAGSILLICKKSASKQEYRFQHIKETGGDTLPPRRMQDLVRKDEVDLLGGDLDLDRERDLGDRELNPPSYHRNLRELMSQPCSSFEDSSDFPR